jgi:hypothetical protein
MITCARINHFLLRSMTMFHPNCELVAARSLWATASLPDEYLDHLKLTPDPDSAVNSSFKLAEAAQVQRRFEICSQPMRLI